MTFEVGGRYKDATGRPWMVMAIRRISPNDTVLLIKKPVPLTNIWEVAVIDTLVPSQADILLDDGVTTLYADQPAEYWEE